MTSHPDSVHNPLQFKLIPERITPDDDLIQHRMNAQEFPADADEAQRIDDLFADGSKGFKEAFAHSGNPDDPGSSMLLAMRLARIATSPYDLAAREKEIVWLIPGAKPRTGCTQFSVARDAIHTIAQQPDLVNSLDRVFKRRSSDRWIMPFTHKDDPEFYDDCVSIALGILLVGAAYTSRCLTGEEWEAIYRYQAMLGIVRDERRRRRDEKKL